MAMIQEQRDNHEPPRYYAYCPCGVCGPIRASHEQAVADEDAHDSVCRAAAWGME
jgi:hypothetical protein